MQKKLHWEIYSNENRVSSIEEIKSIIARNDGSIMNFNMFSDLALTLSVEIEEKNIEKLHNAFTSRFNTSEFEVQNINNESRKEWMIYMNISFSKGTGNLINEIPDVPG